MGVKSNFFSLICVSILISPLSAYAVGRADPPFSKQYEVCSKKAGAVDPALRECLGEEFERQDQELNRIYKALTPKLSPKNRQILLKSERAWIAYRDTTCEFESSGEEGGTFWYLIHGECRVRQTLYRIEDLRKRLEFVKQYPEDEE